MKSLLRKCPICGKSHNRLSEINNMRLKYCSFQCEEISKKERNKTFQQRPDRKIISKLKRELKKEIGLSEFYIKI